MDYSKLYGRIREMYKTQEAFAELLGISKSSLNLRLNNRREWTTNEIFKACELLNIPIKDAHLYFFTKKVEEISTF